MMSILRALFYWEENKHYYFSPDEEFDENIQINISEEERSTHFLAIRVTNPEIIEAAQMVQKEVVNQEEILSDCCMGLGLFHVTLGMLRLEGHEGQEELVQALHENQSELQKMAQDLELKVSGLNTFGQRVLYAQVLPQPEELFWQFVRYIEPLFFLLLLKAKMQKS